MMKAWEELEEKCHECLLDNYGDNTTIEAFGKSDSTKPDIRVVSSEEEFFVEVKKSTSQCCQFVLFPNKETKQFDFSSGNKVPLTDNCQKIIDFMNNDYKKFCKVNKTGISVDIDTSVLFGWVNDFYSFKNVKFFMSEGNEILIFPIEKFSNYFDIRAIYRRKKSGSSEPNEKNNNSEILDGLANENITGTIQYINFDEKVRCFIHSNEDLNKQKMICEDYTYQFKDNSYSKKVNKIFSNVYELRRLSNSNNPNVICQLNLKKFNQDQESRILFDSIMRKSEEN